MQVPRCYLSEAGKAVVAARAAQLRAYLLIRRAMRAARGA